ncbi:hypothetical protein PoB_005402600 [Plakobranchus ocellatus]|uniref:Uncharacterized protein n=1 Tax=Plakobranchus ocellatus TaxID=259542 RepID=A0AAV4BWH3_9GAST|nr:hypothetical protein PoB_005402600 [Plakobranchus ocellatus]
MQTFSLSISELPFLKIPKSRLRQVHRDGLYPQNPTSGEPECPVAGYQCYYPASVPIMCTWLSPFPHAQASLSHAATSLGSPSTSRANWLAAKTISQGTKLELQDGRESDFEMSSKGRGESKANPTASSQTPQQDEQKLGAPYHENDDEKTHFGSFGKMPANNDKTHPDVSERENTTLSKSKIHSDLGEHGNMTLPSESGRGNERQVMLEAVAASMEIRKKRRHRWSIEYKRVKGLKQFEERRD